MTTKQHITPSDTKPSRLTIQSFINTTVVNHQSTRLSKLLLGIDEAGRGPILGPVTVAGVVLTEQQQFAGLTDSKKLSEKKRQHLFSQICTQSVGYAIVTVPVSVIDELNILQATLLGMKTVAETLQTALQQQYSLMLQQILIDGNQQPDINTSVATCIQTVIQGDSLHPCISAASVLAKVSRDTYMYALAKQYPHYGIEKHKGYPTKAHLQALNTLGVLAEHRRSFNPVKQRYQQGTLF